MEFLIISGMSGAGKSRAADVMEDLNYYCVDNLPVALIPRFAELCMATQERYEKVALVMDVRERDGFADLFSTLDSLKNMGCTYRMLFMDADTATLIKRYKESRRPHPLAGNGTTMEEAIRQEYELMTPIRARADYVINSTGMTHGMLQQRLYSLFGGDQSKKTITVNITAFGYKHGIPLDADLVLDVRFLPNPYYEVCFGCFQGIHGQADGSGRFSPPAVYRGRKILPDDRGRMYRRTAPQRGGGI